MNQYLMALLINSKRGLKYNNIMISRKILRKTIKDHLSTKINEVPIEYLPDKWEEYRVLNGVVLIDYASFRVVWTPANY